MLKDIEIAVELDDVEERGAVHVLQDSSLRGEDVEFF